jgi:hypothetical protein
MKNPVACWTSPVRVLACLNSNRLTVVLRPDQGLADGGVPCEIDAVFVPLDLRMPNSEFVLVMRRDTDEVVNVLRKGESLDDSRFVVDN